MVRAAEQRLKAAGVGSIQVLRVPGAFEIPVVVARLTRRSAPVRGPLSEELRPPQAKQRPDVQRLTNVSKPTLTLFQPAEGKRNGTAVVICPGVSTRPDGARWPIGTEN